MKFKQVHLQFILYSCAGLISCFLDFFFFFLFKWIGIPLTTSFIFAFSLATICNYFICRSYIFTSSMKKSSYQIIRIFLVAIVGLILSTWTFSLLNDHTSIAPFLNKTLVIPLTIAWNFWGRRNLVFTPEIPNSTLNAINKFFKIR